MAQKLLGIFFFLILPSTILAESTEAQIKTEITRILEKWPKDFNAKNIPEVCGLFAPDLIASYPGTTDKNYSAMCSQLTSVLSQVDTTYHYEAPQIEQILIQGDLAVVRLIWTLKTSQKNSSDIQIEKGLDVFRLQKDGTWKIAISYAYPMTQ